MTMFRMLKDTADLHRATVARGDAGGVVKTMGVVTTGFPCRISSTAPSERMSGSSKFAEASGVIYVSSAEDVRRGDEIKKDGLTYEVLGVRDPSISNHHREVIVRREEYES